MKALKVEFAPRPRPSLWWWALPLVLLGVAAWLAVMDWALWRDLQQVWAGNEQLRRELSEHEARLRAGQEAVRPRPAYAADALRMAEMARFPLQGVLAALETVSVPGVNLVSVDADAGSGRVRIEVQFSVYADLLSYVEQLNAGEPTPRWLLAQARVTTVGQPALATIESQWPNNTRPQATPLNGGVGATNR